MTSIPLMRILLLCSGLLVAGFSIAEPPSRYPFTDFDSGLRQAREHGKPLFLYFGRHGCGWCDKTNREAFSDTRVRERYSSHYVLVYVDTEGGKRLTLPSGERISEHEFGARLKILATPVFAYLEPDGREIFRIPGLQSAQDFLLYDRYVREGHYRNETIRDFLAREAR